MGKFGRWTGDGQEMEGESKSETHSRKCCQMFGGEREHSNRKLILSPMLACLCQGKKRFTPTTSLPMNPIKSPFSFLMSHELQLTEPASEMSRLIAGGSGPSLPNFFTYERYGSGATSTIMPSQWLKSSLHMLSKQTDGKKKRPSSEREFRHLTVLN